MKCRYISKKIINLIMRIKEKRKEGKYDWDEETH